jgi:hypothetical protein
MKHYLPWIIGGVAIGAFVGYEFAVNLNTVMPWQWIANYYGQQVANAQGAASS